MKLDSVEQQCVIVRPGTGRGASKGRLAPIARESFRHPTHFCLSLLLPTGVTRDIPNRNSYMWDAQTMPRDYNPKVLLLSKSSNANALSTSASHPRIYTTRSNGKNKPAFHPATLLHVGPANCNSSRGLPVLDTLVTFSRTVLWSKQLRYRSHNQVTIIAPCGARGLNPRLPTHRRQFVSVMVKPS